MSVVSRRQALALALGAGAFAATAAHGAAGTVAVAPRVAGPILLNYNENPLGPGPKARAAIAARLGLPLDDTVPEALRAVREKTAS